MSVRSEQVSRHQRHQARGWNKQGHALLRNRFSDYLRSHISKSILLPGRRVVSRSMIFRTEFQLVIYWLLSM